MFGALDKPTDKLKIIATINLAKLEQILTNTMCGVYSVNARR